MGEVNRQPCALCGGGGVVLRAIGEGEAEVRAIEPCPICRLDDRLKLERTRNPEPPGVPGPAATVWAVLAAAGLWAAAYAYIDTRGHRDAVADQLQHLRREVVVLAGRVATLESRPSLAVSSAPVSSVVLPAGTLERLPDGSFRILLAPVRK